MKKDNLMMDYRPTPPRPLQLFRLTLQLQGTLSNAYSMGESVEDAFRRHIAGVVNRKENASEITLVAGDLANPNAHLEQ